jgi:rfaE bifunctional protein nucleotidyltransferase chain/domain/rfaE bifunctional protein kinase chain/domain
VTARALVVVGDALLDADVHGRADRLAPDAPVPVVRVAGESERPGGAGLAAVLARRLAGERPVVLVAPIADDPEGVRLRRLLEEAMVEVVALPHDGRTTVKRRVLAQDGRPVLRLDQGDPVEVGDLPEDARAAIQEAAVVLVSDYGLGTTGSSAVRDALSGRTGRVVWDPHPRGAAPLRGADLVTPNHDEAGSGTQVPDVARRADELLEQWEARAVAITMGARGALLSRGEGAAVAVPAPDAETAGRDTCGAGDCFAAAAALALADGAVTSEAVERAVAEATSFVAAGGVSTYLTKPAETAVDRDKNVRYDEPRAAHEVVAEVRAAGGTVVATGGCFDLLHAGHVATLRAARALGDCLVVLLNSDASVHRLKGPSRPIVPEEDRARVLAALDPVDAVVVFDDETPAATLRDLRPDVWVKGGDYSEAQLPEAAVLREWGGRTVLLPYLDGRSTTSMVEHARAT